MIRDQLEEKIGIAVAENEPLALKTTFKIGGSAEYYVEAMTTEQIVKSVVSARLLGVPVWVFGGGSNVLIGDRGVSGLVIKNKTSTMQMRGMRMERLAGQRHGHVYVEADTGVIMNTLVRYTVDEGLAGLEMHLGLPGTVGGAIYMNSKWTKPIGYVGDVVHQATILDRNNEVTVVPQSYFHFGYDYSAIQETGAIVLSAVFLLKRSSKEALWDIANASIAYRRESQPQGIKSAGCTFQNISEAQTFQFATPDHTRSAGFLVDFAGLKGTTQGGAQISPMHANFIINTGAAKASDVIKLIDRAKDTVKQKFGVTLLEEIVRVGNF